MKRNQAMKNDSKEKNLIIALHSSSEKLGVAKINLDKEAYSPQVAIFNLGKKLSNNLLSSIEELIPAKDWRKIARLAVAIGPGGFTSTRLSVAMARTLAQQIDCSLDGISSFELMAPRLFKELKSINRFESFWITKELPRRGLIAGEYQLKSGKEDLNDEFIELRKPALLNSNDKAKRSIEALDNVHLDVLRLINICSNCHRDGKKSHWKDINPIYPTSPIDNIQ